MTDLGLPPLTPVALHDRDVDAALRALHRRRAARTARTTATVAAGVAAIAILNAGAPAGTSSVSPASELTGGRDAGAERTAGDRAPGPVRGVQPPRRPGAAPAPVAVPTGRATAATHEPSPDPGVRRTHRPDGYTVDRPDERATYRYHDDPATYAYVPGAAPENCRTEGATAHSDWTLDPDREPNNQLAKDFCQSLDGPATVAAGDEVTLRYRVCRSGAPGVVARTLTRGEGQEWFYATWTAADGTGAHWVGETGAAPAQVTVEPGDCAEWTYRFAAMREGYEHGPMAPGTYTIGHHFGAAEFYYRCREPGPGCAVRTVEVGRG